MSNTNETTTERLTKDLAEIASAFEVAALDASKDSELDDCFRNAAQAIEAYRLINELRHQSALARVGLNSEELKNWKVHDAEIIAGNGKDA